MEHLWAPWRKVYIRPKGKKPKGCLFCCAGKMADEAAGHILKKTRHSFAILNIYPYSNGHLMIVPKRHVDRFAKLTPAEKLDLWDLHDEMIDALNKSIRPHGFNVGMNLGQVAGAGVPKHLHLHVVPRWIGDVNFMPVLADTKVIPESLDSVYRSLQGVLKKNRRGRKRKRAVS